MRKAQTATEYLIILSVVIIIALIVVSVMGGIPGIGGTSKTRTSQAYWSTAKIAITSFTVSPTSTTLYIRNNNMESITINSIYLDSTDLEIAPRTLATGESATFTSLRNTCTSGTFSYDVLIAYTDEVSGSIYTSTGNGQTLEGSCATG